AAADIDARRAAGEDLGPIAGVPLAIKDVLVTTDQPTAAADIDARRAAGEDLGPIAGVPLAIKDVLVTT
ncbi:Asp-tRNA(Asn)/Glu-tRNA(Gln) amidotransferase GatCAB subunit A, partial [Methylobacterium radiotolerans]